MFSPKIYKTLTELKTFYKEIISGNLYAVFDEKIFDFMPAKESDLNSGTGYSFFMKNFPKIKFQKNNSLRRNDKINTLSKYKNILTMNKLIVIPAGYRDFQINEYTYDEINNLYNSIILFAKALPDNQTENDMYDSIRYAIQRKVNEIFDYIANIMDGKKGFMLDKYSKRAIALGTRNVISAADLTSTSFDSPKHLKSDEALLPLFQTMKMLQPLLIYNLKVLFFNELFDSNFGQTALIDTKTLYNVYCDMELDDKNKFITSEGLKTLINRFRHPKNRFDPVKVYVDNKGYYLYMVYDDDKEIFTFRNKDDFKRYYEEKYTKSFDMKKVRPLTYMEMFYIATYISAQKKHAFITRYPVLGVGSTYPAKIHVASTDPCRTVRYRSVLNVENEIEFPNYPIIDAQTIDSTILHPSNLALLGGDYDGDSIIGHIKIKIDNKIKKIHIKDLPKHVTCTLYATKTKENIIVNKYKVIDQVEIESINKNTGHISWKPITEFSEHENLEMYKIKSKKKQFKKFWASSDHSLIIYDKIQDRIRECSPKELLENPDNKFLIQNK